MSKELKSLSEFKMQPYILYGLVIYERPKDFPNNYIGRIFNMNEAKATEYYIKGDTLEEVRRQAEESTLFNVAIPRTQQDDKVIVETWI